MASLENAVCKKRPLDEGQIGSGGVLLALGDDMVPIVHLLDDGAYRPFQLPGNPDAPMAKDRLKASRSLRVRSDQDRRILPSFTNCRQQLLKRIIVIVHTVR